MTTTVYIVPAESDQAGQCRIVATDDPLKSCPRDHYRLQPESWREVGIMSSRGALVCLDDKLPGGLRSDISADQPLMAGLYWSAD